MWITKILKIIWQAKFEVDPFGFQSEIKMKVFLQFIIFFLLITDHYPAFEKGHMFPYYNLTT